MISSITLGSCAQNKKVSDMEKENNKALVVYYSETGTTQAIAKKISQATGADIYRIEPEQPYTAADLDWQDNKSRSTKEMNDRTARPAIKNGKVDFDSIDTVYLGYPIWWDQAPRVVNTFIESNDLSDKRIITFCTSGETSIDGSVRQLKADYPILDFVKGKRLNGAPVNEIEKWVSSLKK
ncbi:MAG: flavodoxin [Muribaculaceae bacterium]|nr:flavodoxin [Muribaculaceae bacterium]